MYKLLEAYRLQQSIKQRRLVSNHPVTQPIWRRSQTDNPYPRVNFHQVINQLSVTAGILMADQVALVNNDQVNMTNLI